MAQKRQPSKHLIANHDKEKVVYVASYGPPDQARLRKELVNSVLARENK
jgi:hypothetical protein